MPEKDWIKFLDSDFKIFARKNTFLGIWLSFSVVLIYQDEVCITRYDNAHEAPHRDVLGQRSGLIRKDFCANLSLKKAFSYALDDLSNNFKQYADFYFSN